MSRKPPNMDIPTFDQFMETIVSALPQAEHVKEEDAKIWFEAAKQIDPERFHWHCDRLKGLGGSDIGEIVASHLGEYSAFKTPYDIINEKLLRKTIEPSTIHTRFGSLMEPVSKAIFQEDFNCTSNEKLIQKINNHVSERHPWMRSNVDDVVGIGGPGTDPNLHGVWVIDYKNKSVIPTEPTIQERSQVHQYNYALEEAGFTGPIGRAIVYTDFKAKKTVAKPVDLDPKIVSSILDAGDQAWNHVLQDTKPSFSIAMKSDLVFSDESKDKLSKLEKQIARVKVIADAASKEVGSLQGQFQKEIKEQAGGNLVKGQKMPLQLLSTTIRQKIIIPELENLIESQQLDPKDFKKTGKKLNEESVVAALKVAGMEPTDYVEQVYDIQKILKFCEEKGFEPPVEESVSGSLKATKKNSLSKTDLEEIKSQGDELVRSAAGDVSLSPGMGPTLSPR